jgi:hypothetical protein
VPAAAPRLLPVALLAVALACGACDRQSEQVRSYEIPKEAVEPAAPIGPPAMAGDMDQPVPLPPAAPLVMEWEMPAGWQELENTNPLRHATLVAGSGETAVEVAISQLGGAGGGIAANINRWRGQVGLPPATSEQLAHEAVQVDAAGATGILVDLIGPAGGAGEPMRMLAAIFPAQTNTWFIKATAASPMIEAQKDGFVTLCESVRFADADAVADAAPPLPPADIAPPAAAAPPAPGAPAWGTLPAGWSQDEPPKPMSVASFTIAGEASLTVTPLGGAQDVLANVNRWRRQVGLEPVGALEDQAPEPIDVAGTPGTLVDIGGGEMRTLGVVATRGATTWFYKLTGPDELVAAQKPAFVEFVRSIRLEGGSDE